VPDQVALTTRMISTADAIGAIVEVHPLQTPEDEAKASQLLRAIKTLHAEGEAARKALKAPHLKAGKDVDETFRAPRKALERVERLIKRRLAEAAEAREEKRLAAMAAVREAVKTGDHEGANAALATVDPVFQPEGISERWTYEVESVNLREVPETYLALRQDLVRAEVKAANKEGREPKIPGVVFKRTASIVARKL
jgi:hypothetical protein